MDKYIWLDSRKSVLIIDEIYILAQIDIFKTTLKIDTHQQWNLPEWNQMDNTN